MRVETDSRIPAVRALRQLSQQFHARPARRGFQGLKQYPNMTMSSTLPLVYTGDVLRQTECDLCLLDQSAAANLHEGIEEILTMHRLGLVRILGHRFKTSNRLESLLIQIGQMRGRANRKRTWIRSIAAGCSGSTAIAMSGLRSSGRSALR
jgi:hypothetical protein